ncbi:MAG: universal stress protein [Pseudomonadota bacterium]
MPVRSIVCLHNGYDYEVSALKTAVSLAQHFSAHLRVLHASYVAQPTASYFGEAAVLGAGWQDVIEQQVKADLERARESATKVCAEAGLALSEIPSADLPRAEFVPMQKYAPRTLTQTLSVADLTIVGVPKGASIVDDSVASVALFSTYRPLLVVRAQDSGAPIAGSTCAFAWSGTPEATRALTGAVGILAAASEVRLVTANGNPDAPPSEDQQLALDYLAAHGITARLDVLPHQQGVSAGEAVLTHARSVGCRAIVMGAYGHSVFRETLLGGFSEYMLEEAELPLVLCH